MYVSVESAGEYLTSVIPSVFHISSPASHQPTLGASSSTRMLSGSLYVKVKRAPVLPGEGATSVSVAPRRPEPDPDLSARGAVVRSGGGEDRGMA